MSLGFSIALCAVPYLEVIDREEETLAARVLEVGGEGAALPSEMNKVRQRLAQAVEGVVRTLPTSVRSDLVTSRAIAYALVALADERMLHRPTGGLDRWREHLLEFQLYGSALAGQEVVRRAQDAAYGTMSDSPDEGQGRGGASLLAPLYLALFRAGFEGSLRGDAASLATLVTSLEETVGVSARPPAEVPVVARPRGRISLSPMPLAIVGLSLWLAAGVAVWLALPRDTLVLADRTAERIDANLSALLEAGGPLDRAMGPSKLPADGGIVLDDKRP